MSDQGNVTMLTPGSRVWAVSLSRVVRLIGPVGRSYLPSACRGQGECPSLRALSLMLATAAGVFLQDQVARQISWPLARLARCWPGCAVFDDHCCEFVARAGAMMPSLGPWAGLAAAMASPPSVFGAAPVVSGWIRRVAGARG
jgi:hypothetical protein